jgi:hypothetical protein
MNNHEKKHKNERTWQFLNSLVKEEELTEKRNFDLTFNLEESLEHLIPFVEEIERGELSEGTLRAVFDDSLGHLDAAYIAWFNEASEPAYRMLGHIYGLDFKEGILPEIRKANKKS